MNKLYEVIVYAGISKPLRYMEYVNAKNDNEARHKAMNKARINLRNAGKKVKFAIPLETRVIGGDDK